jgi:hydrogenase expression/formation protein HypE
MTEPFTPVCPIPINEYPAVQMAHGGGGRLMRSLIEKMFLAAFRNPLLEARHDGAVFPSPGGRLATTTDAFVVRPLFFPGGNIGTLAVDGTVNDLAMCGARPVYLTAAFILEEGLPMETLWRVAVAMGEAARDAGVSIVTGDTKVVERGRGDGIYIATAGVGVVEHTGAIGPGAVRAGDAVILSGDIGRHGMAVLGARESLGFESAIESDCAALWPAVEALLRGGVEVHCLRDLTRGGLASAAAEIAADGRVAIRLAEAAIPAREDVRAACELLGLDPLYVANEGRFAAFVPAVCAPRAVELLRAVPVSAGAVAIGTVGAAPAGRVVLASAIGSERVLDLLSGEQLPRIC